MHHKIVYLELMKKLMELPDMSQAPADDLCEQMDLHWYKMDANDQAEARRIAAEANVARGAWPPAGGDK